MSDNKTATTAPRPEEKKSLDQLKAASATGRVKVADAVVFKDKGLSVEDAKKAFEADRAARQGASRPQGGNSPADGVPAIRQGTTRAKLTLINPDGTDGESTVLTADTPAELNAAIANIHNRAQKKGLRLRAEALGNEVLEVQPEPTVEPAEPAEPVAPVAVVAAPAAPAEEKFERRENAKFVLEIRQEDGEWVAEISYKNGAGVERFTAATRKELDMKILEGKANATTRIREYARREKYGTDLDKVYALPEYLTQEAWEKLPEEAQQAMIDNIASQAGLQFQQLHPEYYAIKENWQKMKAWLDYRKLPYTLRNLEYVFEELTSEGDLESRPEQRVSVPSAPVTAAPAADSAAPVVPVVAAPAAAAPATPAVATRKRGSTGLVPGQSSVGDTSLDTPTGTSTQPKGEPSVAELRKLSDAELKTAYRQTMANKPRQF